MLISPAAANSYFAREEGVIEGIDDNGNDISVGLKKEMKSNPRTIKYFFKEVELIL